jgi:Na+/proline symporter
MTVTLFLGFVLCLYTVAMFVIGWLCQGRIRNAEDFTVAGRRLPLSLTWATLLATWFGAGTLLTQADSVRNEGLSKAALDPWGAGVCLLIAGLFFAKPLWDMKLLTLPDFFRRRFGSAAELFAALIMVPSYFGWIAVQFVALGTVLHALFDINLNLAIFLVAMVGRGYTLQGGMWSVTLTDALQMAFILIGLIILGVTTLARLGHGDYAFGMERLLAESDPRLLQAIPTETFAAFSAWLGVFCIGALGNIPGQDLTQRIFAARSGNVARNACLIAGVLYVLFGSIPLLLGLAGRILLPSTDQSVIMALAQSVLQPHPLAFVMFVLAVVSAVLSTIDSAILAPASVLGENVLPRIFPSRPRSAGQPSGLHDGFSLALVRWSVVGITAASLALAYLGESAYELLENAYSMTFVGLFVPLTMGLYLKPRGQAPAIVSMATGTGLWLIHFLAETFFDFSGGFFGSGLSVPLLSTFCGLVSYLVTHAWIGK